MAKKIYSNTQVLGSVTASSLAVIGEYVLPITDGSANQIMITDGAGTVSFVDASTLFSGPASPSKSIQFNDNGSFGGNAKYIFERSPAGAPANSVAVQLEHSDDSWITHSIKSLSNGSSSLSGTVRQTGSGVNGVGHGTLVFGRFWLPNFNIRNSGLIATDGYTLNNPNPIKQIYHVTGANAGSRFEWHYSTANLIDDSGNSRRMFLESTGRLVLHKYGVGTFTGTAARNLSTTSAGVVIEVAGANGTFTSQDGKTITVTNGLITSIV